MNRAKFPLLLGTLLCCLLVSALPRTGLAQGLSKVAITYPVRAIADNNLHVAQARGFFREEGLDVQLERFPSATAIKALTAGRSRP